MGNCWIMCRCVMWFTISHTFYPKPARFRTKVISLWWIQKSRIILSSFSATLGFVAVWRVNDRWTPFNKPSGTAGRTTLWNSSSCARRIRSSRWQQGKQDLLEQDHLEGLRLMESSLRRFWIILPSVGFHLFACVVDANLLGVVRCMFHLCLVLYVWVFYVK